jgi:hypothetical protein
VFLGFFNHAAISVTNVDGPTLPWDPVDSQSFQSQVTLDLPGNAACLRSVVFNLGYTKTS